MLVGKKFRRLYLLFMFIHFHRDIPQRSTEKQYEPRSIQLLHEMNTSMVPFEQILPGNRRVSYEEK